MYLAKPILTIKQRINNNVALVKYPSKKKEAREIKVRYLVPGMHKGNRILIIYRCKTLFIIKYYRYVQIFIMCS